MCGFLYEVDVVVVGELVFVVDGVIVLFVDYCEDGGILCVSDDD